MLNDRDWPVQGKNDLAQELCKKTLVQNKSCSQAWNEMKWNPNPIWTTILIRNLCEPIRRPGRFWDSSWRRSPTTRWRPTAIRRCSLGLHAIGPLCVSTLTWIYFPIAGLEAGVRSVCHGGLQAGLLLSEVQRLCFGSGCMWGGARSGNLSYYVIPLYILYISILFYISNLVSRLPPHIGRNSEEGAECIPHNTISHHLWAPLILTHHHRFYSTISREIVCDPLVNLFIKNAPKMLIQFSRMGNHFR